MKTKRILSILFALVLILTALPVAGAAQTAGEIRNVIIMIGDGMGLNHPELAKEQGYDLFMDANADLRGESKTRSWSEVTDSAAGGTALACGIRTINGTVGLFGFDPLGVLIRARSIAENAAAHGMKTGVVTTDKTSGATPASYSAHVTSRDQAKQISRQQINSGYDLIWGAAESEVRREDAEAQGFTFITTKAEMDALTPGSRSFGQFSGDTWRVPMPAGDPSPSLAQMSEKAISLLDNENGFFLMIEGGHIDKNSHRTDEGYDYPQKIADVANAVKGFDDAIRTAVEFARADGHTIVLVTADHETGDLYPENGKYTFHSGSHTGKNVPVFVYGCDDLFAPGEAVENRSIPVRLGQKLGWSKTALPHADPGLVFEPFRRLLKAFHVSIPGCAL